MDFECRANKNLYQSWMNTPTFILVVYSTRFCRTWLVVSIRKQRNGQKITVNGMLTPAGASLLRAATSKTVDNIFMAFLGQVSAKQKGVYQKLGGD